jgi:hypothetical protein
MVIAVWLDLSQPGEVSEFVAELPARIRGIRISRESPPLANVIESVKSIFAHRG